MKRGIKFLGDVPEAKIPPLKATLAETLREHKDFTFTIDHLGAFPNKEHPKIIWAGITSGKEELNRIALEIKEKLFKEGFKKEDRNFSPHVTLGRSRSIKNHTRLRQLLQELTITHALTQQIRSVILFKSALTSTGSTHEVLEKFRVKEPQPTA